MNRHRRAPLTPIEHDAAGRPLCRTCNEPVPKGRHAFCSIACATDFRIRRVPAVAHSEFRKLYGSRCAGCGAEEDRMYGTWKDFQVVVAGTHLEHLLLPWVPFELDHIRPVADGGGSCGLENYRLLCRVCHRKITSTWLKNRAQRKQAAGPWAASARAKEGYKVKVP